MKKIPNKNNKLTVIELRNIYKNDGESNKINCHPELVSGSNLTAQTALILSLFR